MRTGSQGQSFIYPTVRLHAAVPSRLMLAPIRNLLAALLLLAGTSASAQIPDGSMAPDFTLTDYYGTTHHLYSYLNAGKTVYLEIFAVHCPTCWAYHQTHRLKNLYEQYGPDGTDELMVLALDYDQWNGPDEFMGIGPPWVTAGDWLTGTPYPLFNVEDPDRGVFTDYNVNFYPVLFKICPDGILEQVFTSYSEAQLYQLVQDCQVATSIAEEPDLGAIWIDPGNRSLVIERHQLVQGMEVIDLQGRAVLPTQRPTGRTTDLSALPSGVYLFRMWSEGGVVVRRMFLE